MAPRFVQLAAPESIDAKRAELRRVMFSVLGHEPEERVIASLPLDQIEYLLDHYSGGAQRHVY